CPAAAIACWRCKRKQAKNASGSLPEEPPNCTKLRQPLCDSVVNMNIRSLLEFAVDSCKKAGEIPLKYFQKEFDVETKSDLSPVTIADRSTEEFLREQIQKHFP